jgi:hypothetical protein
VQLDPLTVSDDIRQALLASAAPWDSSREFPIVTDWAALVHAAHVHGLLPLVAEQVQSSAYPAEAKRSFLAHRLSYSGRLMQLERHLARVLTALSASGVPTLVLKGPALANTIYPKSTLRPYGDIDIVCHEEDWTATHETMLQLGYQPVDGLTAPPPKVWARKAYYHTQYFRADQSVLVEVHYDLWQIGLRPRLGERFWKRAQPVTIAGAEGRMLAPEDQLLHLCVHLHHHGYKRLIWFTDLALLLRANPELDWKYVIWAAQQEGVGPSIYYALGYLERLLGVGPPAWVQAALRPSRLQVALHDHLWPAAAIVNLEIDDTVSCGEFHEVPEATELVSNMVLSGRRWEKTLYLARLLAPSNRWLAHYYGTTDPATLRFRRLIHAPKLLGRACRELAAAAVRAFRGDRWVPAHGMHKAS